MHYDIPPSPQTEIVFIARHPAAGEHFADFALTLDQEGIKYFVIAGEEAQKKLTARHVKVISLLDFYQGKEKKELKELTPEESSQLAQSVAKACKAARYVIVDVGHPFFISLMQELDQEAPKVLRAAYYDNPEVFVDGGYSATAAKICEQADIILFANKNLTTSVLYSAPKVPMNLKGKRLIGLGYYPLGEIQLFQKMRHESAAEKRAAFMNLHGLTDEGQQIYVYFGGANSVYYNQAFPHFCSLIEEASKKEDFSNVIIVLQQHGRAKLEGNLDAIRFTETAHKLPEHGPQLVISKMDFSEAVVFADLAFYHQTTASIKLVLAGIPTLQVGVEPADDVLVRNGVCPSITRSDQLIKESQEALKIPPLNHDAILHLYEQIGIDINWADNFLKAFQSP